MRGGRRWYPELISSSISNPSSLGAILMKGLLPAIDLSYNEDGGGGLLSEYFAAA